MLLFLSDSFGIETTKINMLIYSNSFLKNHTQLQTKMGKIYSHFHAKTVQNPYEGYPLPHPGPSVHRFVSLTLTLKKKTYKYFLCTYKTIPFIIKHKGHKKKRKLPQIKSCDC